MNPAGGIEVQLVDPVANGTRDTDCGDQSAGVAAVDWSAAIERYRDRVLTVATTETERQAHFLHLVLLSAGMGDG